MNQMKFMRKSPQFIYQSLPAVTGLIVAGIINVTGGNALQTFMGLTTTAMGVMLLLL